MSQGSEAAEQMTREAIQISEAAAKLAGAGCEEPCGSVSSTGQREPETARQDPHERPASQR